MEYVACLKSAFTENNVNKIKEIENEVSSKIKFMIEETTEKTRYDFIKQRDHFAECLISEKMKNEMFNKSYSDSQKQDKMVVAGRYVEIEFILFLV